ncbi:MAG: M28 family peptidase, partial [Chloroflexota bacterium]
MTLNLETKTADTLALTKEVTEKWTSRLAGSDACLASGEYLQQVMQQFCDTTTTQDFPVRPDAFLGYLRIEVVLFVGGLLALYLQQVAVAAILALLMLIIISFEFLFYYEFVDFLFPLKQGKNVIGTIEPDDEVKQQIIVSAHHDSAHVFNFLADDPKSYGRKIIAGFGSILALVLVTWSLLILLWLGIDLPILYWSLTGLLTVALLFVLPIWRFYAAEGTPGAGDNMVCTAIAIEVGKHFAAQKALGNGLQHTRVLVASWDAEEAGLRGARRYIQQHKKDLHRVKTYNFNLECMYDHQELAFLTSDLNSFV